jgi:gliding motility-associated lipoprotein GldH
MRSIVIVFFISVITILSSCDDARIFEENRKIKEAKWDEKEKIVFVTNIQDTLNGYDFYINLRQASTYPYSNIFFFVDTWFPNGKTARDTVECMLADDKGNWLGKGLGDIKDNKILFKKSVRFPLKGSYAFVFQQAMRVEKLPSVLDVGLRIEKSN